MLAAHLEANPRGVLATRGGIVTQPDTWDLLRRRTLTVWLKAKPEDHTDAMLDDAIARAHVYAAAGASGFFAPGLKDEAMIARLCNSVDLPVNIIALPGTPANARLAELGVARISYGPVPYRNMLTWLEGEARAAIGG